MLLRLAEAGKEITGASIQSAMSRNDPEKKPAITIQFNAEGGDLFWDLTTKNRSPAEESGFGRSLAFVLDRQILTMPRVQGPIREKAQFTGNFSNAEVDSMVAMLRSGALPALLKPQPVSETAVEPAGKP